MNTNGTPQMSNINFKTKPCSYGCGKQIYWHVLENTYFEGDTNQKHICPNRNPNLQRPDNVKYSSYKGSYPRKEVKEKQPVSNTFELLQGSPRTVRMQYQKLCDLIEEVKGKIHGSQSHIVDEGLKMLIYFEVPVGQRDGIHEKFALYLKQMGLANKT